MTAKAINGHEFSVHAMPQWALMVCHSVAVEIVVNDVLRTLWVGATMQNQLREAQALMTIPQRATHAPCKTWMGINVFGGH